MKLLQELSKKEKVDDVPAVPEDGWNVGHLGNHGVILSCEGFIVKLDVDQLNALFDIVEEGGDGEIVDHEGRKVYVEVSDESIVLSRANDKVFPNGVVVDEKTLAEIGIERPEEDEEEEAEEDTIEAANELKEGVKRAFRRQGKKIKRGWRVTSGFRKGRVVASPKSAFKPRAKARTRMKLKVAAKRKKIVRLLKSRITRRKPLSKRLRAMNKRLSGKK
jgi:hypothetical protein